MSEERKGESTEGEEIYYGYFSLAASEAGNRVLGKRTPDGKIINVTYISDDPEARDYVWPDKKYVGECYIGNVNVKSDFKYPRDNNPNKIKFMF